MEKIELKSSISRKSLYKLSIRQRNKVKFEIKNRSRYCLKYNIADENNRDIQNISIPLVTECSSIINNNDNCNYKCDAKEYIFFDDATFEHNTSVVSPFNNSILIESSFRERLALASWIII